MAADEPTLTGAHPEDFTAVWRSLGVADSARVADLGATITVAALAELRGATTGEPRTVPLADADPSDSLPTLPPIALAHSGLSPEDTATAAAQAGPTTGPSGESDLKIIGRLGEGGMGRVHLARQRSLKRDVAVKTMVSDAPSQSAVHALLTEALAMGSLEHPNIPPVHALGRDAAGMPVLVMKRIEGVAWSELLRAPDDARWARVRGAVGDRLRANLEVLLQVCNAVQFAHSRGVVHRDIKPENVMVGEFGEVYLVDWGLAMRGGGARAAPIVGTPVYMAPEMVTGGNIDARTDVYLLGATLHELLVGAPRHAADSLKAALALAYASAPYEYGSEVPAELAAVCNRATAARAGERFEDVLGFRTAVEEFLAHRASIALSDAAREKLVALRALTKGDSGADGDAFARRWYELAFECRFGFVQALRAWEGNGSARAGLQECLVAMARHELARFHVDAAAALLSELPEKRSELEAELALARAEVERRRENEERLRAIERERDVSLGAKTRVVTLIVTIAAVIGIFAVTSANRGATRAGPSHRELLTVSLTTNALLVPLALLLRRSFLASALNRRLFATFATGTALMTADRALGAATSQSAATILGNDLLLITMQCAVTATFAFPWFGWVAALTAAGAVVTHLRPESAAATFTATSASSIALLIVLFRRQQRRPAK